LAEEGGTMSPLVWIVALGLNVLWFGGLVMIVIRDERERVAKIKAKKPSASLRNALLDD
jgi:hypothetical protein